jgi:hypothetical protein
MPIRRYASARVTFTIEVNVRSSWGEKCDLAQVYKQGEDEARGYLHRAFSDQRHVRIIGDPKVEAIITAREEN